MHFFFSFLPSLAVMLQYLYKSIRMCVQSILFSSAIFLLLLLFQVNILKLDPMYGMYGMYGILTRMVFYSGDHRGFIAAMQQKRVKR